jgi:hypothetical protein
MVLKLGPFGNWIRNTWKILKGTAGGWRSVGPIVLKMRNIIQSQGKEEYPTHIKRRKANWIGHILHRNCLPTTHYGRKDRRRNRSDGKMTKKM